MILSNDTVAGANYFETIQTNIPALFIVESYTRKRIHTLARLENLIANARGFFN